MRFAYYLFSLLLTLSGTSALAGEYHIRYVLNATCSSGTYSASKDYSTGGLIGQRDFDDIVKTFHGTATENGDSGAIVFQLGEVNKQICLGAEIKPAWVTIYYEIIDKK